MGNKDKKETKKLKRRIKIRLANPNIPDSYVCEVFDSSLENEEEPTIDSYLHTKEENCKPKNYFEILMAKDSRKSTDNNSAKEIEVVPVETELFRVIQNEEVIKERKNIGIENKKTNSNMKNVSCDYESSDDESLFEIRKKFSGKTNLQKENDNFFLKKKFKNNQEPGKVQALLEIPKIEIKSPKQKSLNILNFFTKVDNTPNYKENSESEKIQVIVKESVEDDFKKINNKLHKNEQPLRLNNVNKKNVKLAPLFLKNEKRNVDLATQKARRDFLFNGPPTVFKKTENKVSESPVSFPTISHIQQKDGSELWKIREIYFPKIISADDYVFACNKQFRVNIDNLDNNFSPVINVETEISKDFISSAKYKYMNYNLDSIIDGLKEKKNNFTNLVKDMEKKYKKSNDESLYESLNILWTEKYKPKSSEILGNENLVNKLGKWLLSWKSFDEQLKDLIKSKKYSKNNEKNDEDDDSDVFISSDEEGYGLRVPTNVCILSGPNGCGKTSLVFALASELEFSVLEVNASSKRTGKKVLTDLQEATQSHKVHRVNLFSNETPQSITGKKIKKRKKKKNKKSSNKVFEQTNDCKISLILVEDADIIFDEHDEGFVSAIQSLVQTSKRPLIFLTNDSNCGYLENFKNENALVLKMENPNFYKSCAVLDVVSSLEGGHVNREALDPLVRQNSFDIRKSLMGLQFWIQSDKSSFSLQQSFDLGHYWWGLCKFLYCQNINHFIVPQSRKRKRKSSLFDSSDDESTVVKKIKINSISSVFCENISVLEKKNPSIQSYLEVLEIASVLDGFRLPGSEEPTPGFDYKAKDSLSLEENMEEVDCNDLSYRISEELVYLSTKVFSNNCKKVNGEKRDFCFKSPSWEEIRWRKLQENACDEITSLVPLHNARDKRSIFLDYLPTIRNICRTERNRSVVNNKRTNRFKHYLYSLGIQITDSNADINCEVFQH